MVGKLRCLSRCITDLGKKMIAVRERKYLIGGKLLVLLVVVFLLSPISSAQPLLSDFSELIDAEMKLGQQAFDAGRFDEAEQVFKKIIKLDSESVEGHYRLGQTYWRMRKGDLAVQHLDIAAKLGNNNASLQMSLAGFFEQAKIMDRAVRQYRRVVELEQDSELGKTAEKRLNLVLVKQYAAASDLDTALQLLNSMLDEYPDDPRVLQHLGFAYLLASRFESAAAIYEEVLEKDPENDSAHMNIAGVYEKMGNLSAAIMHFKLAAQYAKQPERKVEGEVRAGLLESQFHHENGDADLAIESLTNLLEVRPNLSVASNRLSRIYKEQGNLTDAELILEEALEHTPAALDMRLNLASLYIERRNYVDATWELGLIINAQGGQNPYAAQADHMMRQIAQAAGDKFEGVLKAARNKNNLIRHVKKNPDDARARFELGSIYTGQRRYKKAKIELDHVVRIDPYHVNAYLYLGEVNAALAGMEEAVDAFFRYISLETNVERVDQLEGPLASALGRFFLQKKLRDHALYQFKRVVEVTPQDVYAWYQIGVLLGQRGELEEALVAYDKVLEAVEGNGLARFNRAIIYEQLGRESEAFTEYQYIVINDREGGRIKEAAEKKVEFLQARLNGLTATASYSFSYNNNSNLSNFNPQVERTTALGANFTYRYRYSDDWLFGLTYGPTYTTYHVGHYDYLNQSFEPFASYGRRGDLWTFTHTKTVLESLLNESGVSNTSVTKIKWDKTLSEGRQGALEFRFQSFKGATTSRFDSRTYALNTTYSRSLGKGISDGLSYTFTFLDNVDDENADAAYYGNGFTYNASKWFSEKLALSGNLSITRNLYRETDRFTRLANSTIPPTKRLTTLYSLNLSVNYRQSDRFRFFASLTYQENKSNLPVLVLINEDDGNFIIRPIRSDELIGVPLTSSSLGPYERTQLSLGVSINF